MGFLTRGDGRVFHANNHNGQIISPIGTPQHNISGDDKHRLISRITLKNKQVKENHEEKMARQEMQQKQNDNKIEKRRLQQEAIIDEIESRKMLLKQSKNDPTVLDELQRVNPKGGSLPTGFKKDQAEKQKQFINDEIKKANGIKESAEQDIKRAKETHEDNDKAISTLHHEAEQLRKSSSNIPEINHQNDIRLNHITMEINELEKTNSAFQDDIDRAVNQIKMTEGDLDKLRFMNKDTAFGTIGDTPNQHKDTLPIPDEKELAKQRAKKSFDERKFGKGLAAIFPDGFQHKVKTRDPNTGKEKFTSKLPANKKFIGFDKNKNPIFVDNHRPEIAVETNIPRHEEHRGSPSMESDEGTEQRLRIIPGLARERE